MNVTENNIRNI